MGQTGGGADERGSLAPRTLLLHPSPCPDPLPGFTLVPQKLPLDLGDRRGSSGSGLDTSIPRSQEKPNRKVRRATTLRRTSPDGRDLCPLPGSPHCGGESTEPPGAGGALETVTRPWSPAPLPLSLLIGRVCAPGDALAFGKGAARSGALGLRGEAALSWTSPDLGCRRHVLRPRRGRTCRDLRPREHSPGSELRPQQPEPAPIAHPGLPSRGLDLQLRLPGGAGASLGGAQKPPPGPTCPANIKGLTSGITPQALLPASRAREGPVTWGPGTAGSRRGLAQGLPSAPESVQLVLGPAEGGWGFKSPAICGLGRLVPLLQGGLEVASPQGCCKMAPTTCDGDGGRAEPLPADASGGGAVPLKHRPGKQAHPSPLVRVHRTASTGILYRKGTICWEFLQFVLKSSHL